MVKERRGGAEEVDSKKIKNDLVLVCRPKAELVSGPGAQRAPLDPALTAVLTQGKHN